MRALWITALATLAVDQLSKAVVVHAMNLKALGEIEVWPPLLILRMAWNKGVNFGFGASGSEVMRWGLVALAVAISVWVTWWVWREHLSARARVFSGLLVGGALGNVIDRVVYGAVADFLNMSCCGLENPWSFNIADVGVFAGAIGLALFSGVGRGQKTP